MNYSEMAKKLNIINQHYAQLCKMQYDVIHDLVIHQAASPLPIMPSQTQLTHPTPLPSIEFESQVALQNRNASNSGTISSNMPSISQRQQSEMTDNSLFLANSKTPSVASDVSISTDFGFDAASESTTTPTRPSLEKRMECKTCKKQSRTKRLHSIHEKNCKGKRRSLNF